MKKHRRCDFVGDESSRLSWLSARLADLLRGDLDPMTYPKKPMRGRSNRKMR
jgi:hypothetical protein